MSQQLYAVMTADQRYGQAVQNLTAAEVVAHIYKVEGIQWRLVPGAHLGVGKRAFRLEFTNKGGNFWTRSIKIYLGTVLKDAELAFLQECFSATLYQANKWMVFEMGNFDDICRLCRLAEPAFI